MTKIVFYLAVLGAILVFFGWFDVDPPDSTRFGLSRSERTKIAANVELLLRYIDADRDEWRTFDEFKTIFSSEFNAILNEDELRRYKELREFVNTEITKRLNLTRREIKKELTEKRKTELIENLKEIFNEVAR